MNNSQGSLRRLGIYLGTGTSLLILFFFARRIEWNGSTELHTLTEVMATMLALMTGCLALMRYYSKHDKTFLLIGTAFIGTAFLDGYHATVSSNFFSQFMPSANQSLIPWSWLASRIFISVFFFLSALAWFIHRRNENTIWENEQFIFAVTAIFTLACFLFFVLTPLPSGYVDPGFIHRPAEYIPGLFFLLALACYLYRGEWKQDTFNHWLVLSLIVNLAAQFCFMPTSSALFDLEFDTAHVLKNAAYICVLIGLLINMYRVFEEEKLLKHRLHESESKYRTITESSHDAIIRYDRRHRFTYVNPAAALVYGHSPEDLLGKSISDISLPEYLWRNWQQAIDTVFDSGKPQSMNYVLRSVRGELTVDWKCFPEFDDEGKVESVISVSRDISDFKQREEEKRRIHKLESIGLMAGGIAHDFNNILVGLFGNISLARNALPAGHESSRHLDRAEQAFNRATQLTKQFLTFAQGGNPIKTPVDLNKVVDEVVQFNLAGTDTKTRIRTDPGLWPIQADEGQISQVIANLVINASQAMHERGSIHISMENAVIGDGEKRGEHNEYVRLVIRDEGEGIKAEHLDKIFDPYFSTKHSGRGLGLATVYSIVRQHDANIYVKSSPGAGTIVTLLLPAEAAEAPARPPREHSDATPQPARILLMDDEELVLEVTASILQALGHSVDIARHGEEAIDKYREALEAGRCYDCLIMDLTVPNGMGGKEAMEGILAIHADALALVSSGYATDPVMSNPAEYGFAGVIPKPFTMRSLKEALDEVLAAAVA